VLKVSLNTNKTNKQPKVLGTQRSQFWGDPLTYTAPLDPERPDSAQYNLSRKEACFTVKRCHAAEVGGAPASLEFWDPTYANMA